MDLMERRWAARPGLAGAESSFKTAFNTPGGFLPVVAALSK